LSSDSKLSMDDLASAAKLAVKLGNVSGVKTAEAPAKTSVAGPIPSEDGKAVDYIVQITDTENVKTVVAELRSVAGNGAPSSTIAYVTGPAGLTADLA